MTKFKFFRGYIGTLDVMDGQTYPTASIYNPNTYWTPEESERIRNQRIQISNDLRDDLRRDLENIERYGQLLERQVDSAVNTHLSLFQATTTVTVNPTLWTKVKIFGTGVKLALKATWKSEPIGVIYMTLLMCLITFIGIMKLFGA
jgi:hypothetical protein